MRAIYSLTESEPGVQHYGCVLYTVDYSITVRYCTICYVDTKTINQSDHDLFYPISQLAPLAPKLAPKRKCIHSVSFDRIRILLKECTPPTSHAPPNADSPLSSTHSLINCLHHALHRFTFAHKLSSRISDFPLHLPSLFSPAPQHQHRQSSSPIMVRLVSSRLHRCYSRKGGQRSARNERLISLTHLLTVLIPFLSHPLLLSYLPILLTPPIWLPVVQVSLLLVVHLHDFYATFIAHRLYYRWSKVYKRPPGFLATATKVDAAIVACHLSAVLVLFATRAGLVARAPPGAPLPLFVSLAYSIAACVGTLLNAVLALPSLDFVLPGVMMRAHNVVVISFVMASVMHVTCVCLLDSLQMISSVDAGMSVVIAIRQCVQMLRLGADGLVCIGAMVNLARVWRFVSANTRGWAGNGGVGGIGMRGMTTDGNGAKGTRGGKGFLAWWKGRPVDVGSDAESEDFDEGDTEYDEEWAKRRPGP